MLFFYLFIFLSQLSTGINFQTVLSSLDEQILQSIIWNLFLKTVEPWTMNSLLLLVFFNLCLTDCALRCPWLSECFSVAVPIYNGVIFLFVLANFCMATFMDPGIFPRGETASPHNTGNTHTHTHRHQWTWRDYFTHCWLCLWFRKWSDVIHNCSHLKPQSDTWNLFIIVHKT